MCFVESNGAAPSEAQIPAPLLPLALGLWLGQAGSQLGGFAPQGWQRRSREHARSLPLFLGDVPCPSATPSLKLPAPALLAILLATKPWGLAGSSSQGFSLSYLVRATQGGQWPAWLYGGRWGKLGYVA